MSSAPIQPVPSSACPDNPSDSPAWLSSSQVAKILGCNRRHIAKLGKAGYITVRRLPGAIPRYLRADVERLAAESVHVATQTTGAK